jgi:hypothetical protein
MHTCDSGDVVTMVVIVVESGEVGVGGTVTGGVFEAHPLTMTSPATISKRTSKPA